MEQEFLLTAWVHAFGTGKANSVTAKQAILHLTSLDGVTGLCQVRGALGTCLVVVPRCDGVN